MDRRSRNRRIVRALVCMMSLTVSSFWPRVETSAQQQPRSMVSRTMSGTAATTILGRDVVDSAEEDVGQLVDILVDKAAKPIAGVIDVGGFLGVGKRRVAVAWHLLRLVSDSGGTRIRMDLTFYSVAAAPEFQGSGNSLIVIATTPP